MAIFNSFLYVYQRVYDTRSGVVSHTSEFFPISHQGFGKNSWPNDWSIGIFIPLPSGYVKIAIENGHL